MAGRSAESSEPHSCHSGSDSGCSSAQLTRKARRARQLAARDTADRKLQAAFGRVQELEDTVVALRAANAAADDAKADEEIRLRLHEIANALVEQRRLQKLNGDSSHCLGLAVAKARSLDAIKLEDAARLRAVASRRNLAAHEPFGTDADAAAGGVGGDRFAEVVDVTEVDEFYNFFDSKVEEAGTQTDPCCVADVDTQTTTSFADHGLKEVVLTDPRSLIDIGFGHIAFLRLQVHKEVSDKVATSLDELETYEAASQAPFEADEGIQEFDFLAGAASMSRAKVALAAYTEALTKLLDVSDHASTIWYGPEETAKKESKNVRRKANKLLKKNILALKTRVTGASITEARAIAKTISMEELTMLEKHMAIGPSGSGVCDFDSDIPGFIMKPSRRRRRIAWVLWMHEALSGD
jgi:hypothetical protein